LHPRLILALTLPARPFKLDLAVELQLHKLLHLAVQAWEAGLSLLSLLLLSLSASTMSLSLLPLLTTLDKVLPCTGYVDARCVAQ
jgi:hypothetical protein